MQPIAWGQMPFLSNLSFIAEFAKRRIPEIAGILILLSAIATAMCVLEYRQQSDAVQHALEVKNALAQLLSTLQDAETGQRGFLLTGDDAFQQPYTRGIAIIRTHLADVRNLTGDNEVQQRRIGRIEHLVSQKLAELAARIEEVRTGSKPSPQGLRSGKDVMDAIRAEIADMRLTEDRLFEARTKIANRFILIAAAMAAITAAIAVAAVSMWVWQSRALTKELQHANLELTGTIAQRDLAESKARQLQKLEAIGQLTGGIAHDFNNILAVIIAGLSLSNRRSKTLEEAKPFMDGALEAAHRGAELTRRLLAFARQQPLIPRTLNVNRMVSEISELISRAVGETVRTETVLAGGAWLVNVDANQLQNAVLNLAVNARDAMPDGGSLTIETANCHLDDRYSRQHDDVPPGQYVMLSITDTGTGMTADVASRAFEPFFTTKDAGKGTGLGLSQVHGFVRQSNGHIKIYTEPGEGTTVKMYFPRHVAPAEEELKCEQPIENLPKGQPSTLVLVVEDDTRVRSLSVALLRELGYSVVHADDARSALAKLDSHPTIGLLFTDVVMPEMSGRKLADVALQRRPDLKVLYTTGFTKNAVIHGGILDRGVNFLAKPFTLEELAFKVHEVLLGDLSSTS
jgi:signal transduction histidine kinase/CheY-like chemotaxis protein